MPDEISKHGYKTMATGVLGVVIVIGLTIGLIMFTKGRGMMEDSNSKMTKLGTEISESDMTMYDGSIVSGSEVVNAIKRFKTDEISIKVTTKSKNVSYYIRSLSVEDKLITSGVRTVASAQVKTSDNYINPTGMFEGTIVRDKNDVCVGIEFIQQ